MANPQVLVVLPTLGDRLGHLATALSSCAQLATLLPITIVVVVPDGATAARESASESGALVVSDPGTGMADAVNRAIAHRTTEDFYVWLGDDDVLLPQGIVALVESLVRAPDAVVAFGRCDYVNDAGAVIVTSRAGSLARWLLPWGPNFIPHPGTVIRLQALEKVGGFDPRLLYALDLDVFLKLRRIGNFVTLSVTASQFRWHAESLTVADRWASSKEAMRVKRSHLPLWLRPFSPLWHWPVAGASALAAKRVSRLSAQLR